MPNVDYFKGGLQAHFIVKKTRTYYLPLMIEFRKFEIIFGIRQWNYLERSQNSKLIKYKIRDTFFHIGWGKFCLQRVF